MKSETLSGAFIVGIVLLFLGAYFIPWKNVNWGSLQWVQPRTITVSGEAIKQEQNQLASFTAGVDAVNANKDTAIAEVNKKMDELVNSVKTFGIPESDIKTQNMSVYQEQESYYDSGAQTQRSRPGQWRVSNSVEITVKDVAKVQDLNTLLAKSGATNVYGPNYRTDETQRGDDLLNAAVKNAQEKAQSLAESQGATLGKVLQVVETGAIAPVPMYRDMGGGGGGAAAFPGTTTLSKSVSVTFELE